MKKILSLLSVAILTSSSISSSVAFTKQKIKYNKNNFKRDIPNVDWKNVNLNDFIVPYHPLNIPDDGLYHAINPNIADINININGKFPTTLSFVHAFGNFIDIQYQNYLENYYNDTLLFYEQTEQEATLNNYLFTIKDIRNDDVLDFSPETLNEGEWASYNLKFINNLNNSSFNFSVNICNFDQDAYDENSINFGKTALPSMDDTQKEYSVGAHYINTHVTDSNKENIFNIDDIEMTVGNNPKIIASFDNMQQAGFFLNPIEYKYHYDISEYGNFSPIHPEVSSANWPNIGTATQNINLSQIRSSTIASIENGDNDGIDNDGNPNYNNLVNQASVYMNKDTNELLNLYAFNEIYTNSEEENHYSPKTEVCILFQACGWSNGYDAWTGEPYHLHIAYYGDSLTTSIKKSVFVDSSSYQNFYKIQADYNPAQQILDTKGIITNRNIDIPFPWFRPDISEPWEDGNKETGEMWILKKFVYRNPSFKKYVNYNYSNLSIILADGGKILKTGDNSATLKLKINSYEGSKKIHIIYKGSVFERIDSILTKALKQQDNQIEYMGPDFIGWHTDDCHIDTNQKNMMDDLINSIGLQSCVASQEIDFNNKYGKYISFDKEKMYSNKTKINLYLNVNGVKKTYSNINIWWRSMSKKQII